MGREGADADGDEDDPLLIVDDEGEGDGEDGRAEGADGRDADGLPPPRVTALPLDGVPDGRGR